MTWSEQPTNTTENAVTNRSSVGGSCAPTPMTWDITTIAKQWATDVGNYGLVLDVADGAGGPQPPRLPVVRRQ